MRILLKADIHYKEKGNYQDKKSYQIQNQISGMKLSQRIK